MAEPMMALTARGLHFIHELGGSWIHDTCTTETKEL